ncbi:gluconokinase [Arthrobacter sp. NPDC056727]|uniref:gluconokinase n=1 Tax=Arthrobacter sp. NPDC056727 TaxID=3345927 RepID=UPI0036721C37
MMTTTTFPPIVVMGVSGCGKSTVGSLLAQRLGLTFIDGDDLHPAANKQKMGSGTPLNEDRHPWLAEIGRTLRGGTADGRNIIVACSALKRRYRNQLRAEAGNILFLHLTGDPETLSSRVAGRQHEFMPAAMLASQLAALEPLDADELHLLLDIRESPAALVEQARQALMNGSALRAAGSPA